MREVRGTRAVGHLVRRGVTDVTAGNGEGSEGLARSDIWCGGV